MLLRCPGNKVYGESSDDAQGILEVYCSGRWCGKRPNTVVVHRFNLSTGEITTRAFKKPNFHKELKDAVS